MASKTVEGMKRALVVELNANPLRRRKIDANKVELNVVRETDGTRIEIVDVDGRVYAAELNGGTCEWSYKVVGKDKWVVAGTLARY